MGSLQHLESDTAGRCEIQAFIFFEKNCKSDLSLKVPKLELISVCVSLNFSPCERQS